jgi:hypothetical protein
MLSYLSSAKNNHVTILAVTGNPGDRVIWYCFGIVYSLAKVMKDGVRTRFTYFTSSYVSKLPYDRSLCECILGMILAKLL